jgi:hypothetical protein
MVDEARLQAVLDRYAPGQSAQFFMWIAAQRRCWFDGPEASGDGDRRALSEARHALEAAAAALDKLEGATQLALIAELAKARSYNASGLGIAGVAGSVLSPLLHSIEMAEAELAETAAAPDPRARRKGPNFAAASVARAAREVWENATGVSAPHHLHAERADDHPFGRFLGECLRAYGIRRPGARGALDALRELSKEHITE